MKNNLKIKIGSLLIGTFLLSSCEEAPKNEQITLKSGVDLSAIDETVRPQDDFFAYANGTWLKNTEIPASYSSYSTFTEVFETVEVSLKTIVEDVSSTQSEMGTEAQKIGDLYAGWMDVDYRDGLGLAPIQSELDIIAGISDRAGLLNALTDLQKIGVGGPFVFYVSLDDKDITKNIPHLYQSGLTLPNRDYYLNLENQNFTKAREALPAYFEEMLIYSGMEEGLVKVQAQAIFELETKIAEIQWSSVDNRDPEKTYNAYQMDNLSELSEKINWKSVFVSMGAGDQPKVVVNQPTYIDALGTLLNEIPLETWKSYLTFNLLENFSAHLTKMSDQISFNFRGKILSGAKEQRPMWKRGISIINGNLGEALGKLYVERHFPPEAKARMQAMVDNITATFGDSIRALDWMSGETKSKALEKLGTFKSKIGYPDVWRDYSTLDIKAGDHMGNLRRSIQYNYDRSIAKLGKPADPNEWFMTPQTVNAYYSPTQNEIVFPAARLSDPLFVLDAEDAINYGAVGGVIGHEMGHGFDDSGSQYDKDGFLNNWWTDEDRQAFEERTQILIEQYDSFEVLPDMFLNGKLTLGENIGDVSGLDIAYRAYIKSLNGVEPPVIDGFTAKQRFFLGYAKARKGKYREERLISQAASGPHSPLKYRVNGTYRNLNGFYEAFGVKEGDGMYLPPNKRFKIW